MSFQPIRIVKLELSLPLPPIEKTVNGVQYGSAQILVRLHHHPLGMIEVPLQDITLEPAGYAPLIWDALGSAVNDHLGQDGLPPVPALPLAGIPAVKTAECLLQQQRLLDKHPLISVVICTHERAALLEGCLDSVFNLAYPNYEIVVVDNAPRSDATRKVVESKAEQMPNLRYVLEPNQGQCWARNAGAKAARGEIIAFTDDDVIVDSQWLIGVLRGFAASDRVGAVNGLTIPAELETEEQTWFEQSGGFNKGYERTIYDMQEHRPARPFYPLSAGIFGTGANLSIRKSALEKVGYFDPALGAGTITTCGDDLAMYVQLLYGGFQLVYEPSAFLQHIHRRDFNSLQKQIYNYGVGFTAFITKTLLDHPGSLPGFLLRIPYGLFLLFSPGSFKNRKKESNYPADLKGLEYRGMLKGGFAYLKSRRQTRRLIQQRAQAEASISHN
jgi:glycosyltransferase involved in cell wall biosynthesis